MSISEPFIRRPAGTSLLAAGLLLLGIVAYHFLPVAPVPRVEYPVIMVSASLPGADAATVASSLAAPLEKQLGQIAGISEMTSVSTLGGSTINIQFDLDRKVESAAQDVMAAINAASSDLPINMPSKPNYRKINPADAPIMVLALTSDTLSALQVYEYSDTIIAQRLSQVEGVSQVVINGAEKAAVRVQVDPGALASTGLSLDDVRNLLSQVNVDAPKGSVESDGLSYSISVNDQLMEARDYESLILTQRNNTPIRLNSIGRISDGVENERLAGWVGTQRAVLIIVFKQPDANVIETVDRIKDVLPHLQTWLPPTIKITRISDRTTTIRSSVAEVQFSLMLSIALVVMVVFLFLRRFWPTFIASVTVPLALAGTFGAMYLFDFSIDNLSLMAITISVGFVVDDAIVVIENVYRFIEAGEPAFASAIKGARQIAFTVVSMSLSLVAVFIPLLFMGGLVGRLFHEFAVTLSVAILVSGVISLTVTPMLCAKFLRSEGSYPPPGWFNRLLERAFNSVLHSYERGLKWVLKHQPVMLIVTALTIALTVFLFGRIPKGFFPQQDTGSMMAVTEAAQDISFKAMAELQTKVAGIIMSDPAVEALGSFIGAAAGSGTVNNGRMFITLKPLSERKVRVETVIARIRAKMANVAGITVFLSANQDIRVGGRMSKSQYQYALQSSDLAELNQWSTTLLARLRKLPELRDVTSDQQLRGMQVNVAVDRDAAARLGVSPAMIDNILYDAFGQRQVSTIYKRYNQHYVILEVDPEFLKDPRALEKIFLKSTTGKQIPLSAVAKFRETTSNLSVNHQSQFPAITISFNLVEGVSLGEATTLIQEAAQEMGMPSSVQGSFQGTAQVFQSSISNTPILLLAALVTVYVVLGMLYESLIHPLTILSTLPSAGVGALLALSVFGLDLSLVSFIGIILLIGIVKKNAIMMIDFALDAEKTEGLSPEDAIYKACIIRFRPIMMTTMAALLGAIPLAMSLGTGAELRQPLGIAVVGGLIVSQVLTLYTTPVVYLFFEHLKLRFRRSKHVPQGIPAPAHG
ncbi:MAG: Acriflavin resistance protein [Verrucomicrobiales bacterium]|nr:Acriflavin resistance protein [Verrucomicrobiales bacterium]MDB6129640.1 Acriflavin resistance protein [Verrucomicrobiales bacterium]